MCVYRSLTDVVSWWITYFARFYRRAGLVQETRIHSVVDGRNTFPRWITCIYWPPFLPRLLRELHKFWYRRIRRGSPAWRCCLHGPIGGKISCWESRCLVHSLVHRDCQTCVVLKGIYWYLESRTSFLEELHSNRYDFILSVILLCVASRAFFWDPEENIQIFLKNGFYL